MNPRILNTIALLLLLSISTFAQEFHTIENAIRMDNGCIRLTSDKPYQRGITYCKTKLDLSKYFEIEFDIFLGDKNELGADGITFVIHNDSRGFRAIGTWGECMGYGRWNRGYYGGNFIAPSIAVEFDTYQNYRQNDPACDHVAYLENGTNFHKVYYNNKDSKFNLEDGSLHNFRFRWEPQIKKVTVYLDNVIVHEGTRDLIKDIFQGQTKAIWGFTASTGNKHNLQFFCLRRWATTKPSTKPTTQQTRVR